MASTYTLVQLSDTHVLPDGKLLYDQVDTLANAKAAMDAVERSGIRPDALIVSGDLTDTGDPDAYERLRAVITPAAERIGTTLVYVMGNHDLRGPFRAGLLGEEPANHPYDHVVRVGGLRIVALDSTVPGKVHGRLTSAQLEWLRAELATPATDGTVVTMHHPPVPSPMGWDDVMLLREADKLAEVIAGTDVRAVLAGHAHHPAAGSFAGVPVWIAGAVSYTIDPIAPAGMLRGLAAGSLTRVELRDGGVVAAAVPLGHGEPPIYEEPLPDLSGS